MRIRTRIGQEAKVRGLTSAEVARRLGWHRSNLSAMDAGARSVSLRALARVAEVLGCSPGDLLEAERGGARSAFRDRRLNQRLHERDVATPDGSEKGWVHAAQLAWRRHYSRARAR
jgi:transcriptional regulator with XRE-family HTH domain